MNCSVLCRATATSEPEAQWQASSTRSAVQAAANSNAPLQQESPSIISCTAPSATPWRTACRVGGRPAAAVACAWCPSAHAWDACAPEGAAREPAPAGKQYIEGTLAVLATLTMLACCTVIVSSRLQGASDDPCALQPESERITWIHSVMMTYDEGDAKRPYVSR